MFTGHTGVFVFRKGGTRRGSQPKSRITSKTMETRWLRARAPIAVLRRAFLGHRFWGDPKRWPFATRKHSKSAMCRLLLPGIVARPRRMKFYTIYRKQRPLDDEIDHFKTSEVKGMDTGSSTGASSVERSRIQPERMCRAAGPFSLSLRLTQSP